MDRFHLYNDLYEVLKTNERFCTDDGKLNKAVIEQAATSLDGELLSMLLSTKNLKKHFFKEVNGMMVFDKVDFLKFIINKNLLHDDYSFYKERIGLTNEHGQYIADSQEVVLSWKYKDCMLEGGQTKEDQKHDEVFWNTILASDEINRLTEGKAFVGFKRYDKDGEHEVEHLMPNDNLIIKGNNLLALYSLREKYAGRVKLIYIDPPFNTGNDSFMYNDTFNHSTWMTFMKNRLEVAHDLLANDGVIFIHLDDIESSYLKVLADQIFGRENFVNIIAVKSSTPSGTKTAHKDKTIIKQKDLILCYRKGGETRFNPQYVRRSKFDTHYGNFLEKNDGNYTVFPLIDKMHELGYCKNISSLKNLNMNDDEFRAFYFKYADNIFQLQSHKSNEARKKSEKLHDQVYVEVKDGQETLYYNGRMITPLRQSIKLVYHNQQFIEDLGMLLCDFWDDIDFQNTQNEGGISFPTAKKPELLLYRIISLCTKPGDIVMDFFLGSGTTAAVAHKMERRYIGCEQMDYGKNDSVARLKNVINGEKSGASKGLNWQGGGSFVYCELAKANEIYREEIFNAKEESELNTIWNSMQATNFLSYKIDPKKIDVTSADFTKLTLDEKKRFLMECLDMNQLYIPFADMDNPDYEISAKDKELTREFYGVNENE